MRPVKWTSPATANVKGCGGGAEDGGVEGGGADRAGSGFGGRVTEQPDAHSTATSTSAANRVMPAPHFVVSRPDRAGSA
ncbi:hypothetical protein Vau01_030180 [Virgisporangium aurantiacum]|uniref:Uncharacterized protein n=1 Tax=Virgisporangium aurantiacum TaxID=175570 RepID=A0A8J3Z2J7_9ACTN|nr:hypothetical protein Vau01_030180 [Virgisporangium aurantiacum]